MLGTFVEVSVQDKVSDKSLIQLTNTLFKQIEIVEGLMNFHNTESELSYINRHAHLNPVSISADMVIVITQALTLSQLTEGLYDISIAPKLIASGLLPDYGYEVDPTAHWQDIILDDNNVYFQKPLIIDLGGIAKGYAVDKAVAAAQGCEVIVNAGGDLKMSHWQNKLASVRVPYSVTGKTVDIPMQASALATSGHYFLDGKVAIIDPKNKQKIDEDISISIFAESCMLADALTKVAFLYQESQPIFSALQASVLCLNRHGEISS